MDEIDPSLLASYQIRRWSARYFIAQASEGHALLSQEIKARLFNRKCVAPQDDKFNKRQQGHPSERLTTTTSSTSAPNAAAGSTSTACNRRPLVVVAEAFQVDLDDDHQATSLKYGIIILSKLVHAIGLWIPSFVLDISLDLKISNFFVLFCYLQLAAFLVIGLIVAKWVLEPSLVRVLGKLAPNVMQVFTWTVFFSEICYLSYGLLGAGYIVYQRHFIQDFFLYRCTMIALPRSYQRRKIVSLLLALYVFALSTEPLFALLSLYYDLEQPQVWPRLSQGWFQAAKWGTIALTSLGASLLSVCGILIPLMTCFLMLASARHLKITLEKQLVRYRRAAGAGQHQVRCRGQPSSKLEALLDDRTRKIIDDYSCLTLTMDFPEMVDTRQKRRTGAQESPIKLTTTTASTSASATSCSSTTTTTCCPSTSSSSSLSSSSVSSRVAELGRATCGLAPVVGRASQQQLSASASGLLFLYKNLLKNMSEIKQMIRLWESKFANFHLVYTLLNGLIVAQWITVAFTEVRGRNLSDASEARGRGEPSETGRASTSIDSYRISPFVVRIMGGVLTFIVSNIYIILWCDCLSRRLIKIKAQLFKMNIDLTNSHVLSRGPPLELFGEGAAPGGMARRRHNTRAAGPVHGQYAEIDQIWSLYDQVDRLASTTLFKFSSDTYYSKQCLLVIFGRSVSVLLLFIQIIEMYS